MLSQPGRCRYNPPGNFTLAEGWRLERLTKPSRLFGANGLRTGTDGRIYVAQVAGSQVSAVDVDSGDIETISPMGGDIVAPDDLVFDKYGNLYATEITEGRVSMLGANGQTHVVCGDMPCANPITMYQGRLFAGECRPGGRIMELDLHGGAPCILLNDVPMPNAMEVGPDGMLYFPVMSANEIWRVSPEGGEPEVVARDLGVPDAVKFDSNGYIVSTQVASGQVLRIDPRSGKKTVLADIAPGLDNLTFVGNRLFVSSISGQINEILESGKVRALIPDGLQWPLGLAVNEAGALFVADGGFTYLLQPGAERQLAGMLFSPGFPGYTRGVAAVGSREWVVTTANGDIARFWPAQQASQVLASGFDRLMGVAIAPGGAAVCAEYGTGRVLAVESGSVTEIARGLSRPMGVAIDAEGNCFVAESEQGRVLKLCGNRTDVVLDGLQNPHGIVLCDQILYIVDVGARELLEVDLASSARRVIASGLPVGAPPGVIPKPLGPIGNLAGPMVPFSGITAAADGTLYVSADAEGSVIMLGH